MDQVQRLARDQPLSSRERPCAARRTPTTASWLPRLLACAPACESPRRLLGKVTGERPPPPSLKLHVIGKPGNPSIVPPGVFDFVPTSCIVVLVSENEAPREPPRCGTPSPPPPLPPLSPPSVPTTSASSPPP